LLFFREPKSGKLFTQAKIPAETPNRRRMPTAQNRTLFVCRSFACAGGGIAFQVFTAFAAKGHSFTGTLAFLQRPAANSAPPYLP
jgi:hypothetical protein